MCYNKCVEVTALHCTTAVDMLWTSQIPKRKPPWRTQQAIALQRSTIDATNSQHFPAGYSWKSHPLPKNKLTASVIVTEGWILDCGELSWHLWSSTILDSLVASETYHCKFKAFYFGVTDVHDTMLTDWKLPEGAEEWKIWQPGSHACQDEQRIKVRNEQVFKVFSETKSFKCNISCWDVRQLQ